MPLVATFKTDWFRVITDLTRKNLTTQEIANELGVSKSAVLGWKSGSEPRHGHGEALIALWCMATSSDRKNYPRFYIVSGSPSVNRVLVGKLTRMQITMTAHHSSGDIQNGSTKKKR
jgi:hypothetical protein